MNLIPGWATPEATGAYANAHAGQVGEGHFSEFIKTRIQLSSLGLGTFPGEASSEQDAVLGQLVSQALQQGVNVIDTAAHYRYGRSLAAIGAGIRDAMAGGVPREAMFVVSKGGFLTLRGGRPADMAAWFEKEIVQAGLGTMDDLAKGAHLLTPQYINYQLDLSRQLLGLETLDAFLVDQPEVHIERIGKEKLNQRLLSVFVQLEQAVAEGRLRYYGISTFDGFRVETDHPLFQSLTSMMGLAEKAAQQVTGKNDGKHHFRLVQLPFNQVMNEGFTRFNQATGQDNIASTLQAAWQLKLYVMGSHSLMKGRLAQYSSEALLLATPTLANSAQRALQFCRSTPGIGTALVGVHRAEHLQDLLAVAARAVLKRETYLAMYQRT
ncbi:MAG: aldo/keto reductase [Gammaproteobacteria bacterium]|nr:aldo/keto reductase [Gammaproteobacteria bacterium]